MLKSVRHAALVVAVMMMGTSGVVGASSPSLADKIAAAREAFHVSPISPNPATLNVAEAWMYTGLKYAVREKCFRMSDTSSLSAPIPCIGGDRSASTTIVLFGDSSVGSWIPALRTVGRQHHWRVASFQFEGCSLAHVSRLDPKCVRFHHVLPDVIAKLHPAVVIGVGGTSTSRSPADAVFRDGVVAAFDHIRKKSPQATYILWGTTPRLAMAAATCLNARQNSMNTCGVSTTFVGPDFGDFASTRKRDQTIATQAKVRFVDVASWFCVAGWCPGLVDHTVVYADSRHITEKYSQLIAPQVGQTLTRILNP